MNTNSTKKKLKYVCIGHKDPTHCTAIMSTVGPLKDTVCLYDC